MRPILKWKFNYWTVNGKKISRNPILIIMDRNTVLVAHYKRVLNY